MPNCISCTPDLKSLYIKKESFLKADFTVSGISDYIFILQALRAGIDIRRHKT